METKYIIVVVLFIVAGFLTYFLTPHNSIISLSLADIEVGKLFELKQGEYVVNKEGDNSSYLKQYLLSLTDEEKKCNSTSDCRVLNYGDEVKYCLKYGAVVNEETANYIIENKDIFFEVTSDDKISQQRKLEAEASGKPAIDFPVCFTHYEDPQGIVCDNNLCKEYYNGWGFGRADEVAVENFGF